jgi:hypothetical protein
MVALGKWISESTAGCSCVVEFGAGFFDKLAHVNPAVEKIGIEIWPTYLDKAKFQGAKKILGDFRNYEDYIDVSKMDCALFVDSLEHIVREEALELMERVKKSFNKVVLMIPEGSHPQEKDLTGHGAHDPQTHRSSWEVCDIEAMGFQEVIVDPVFHAGAGGGKDSGCIFAVWTKDKE